MVKKLKMANNDYIPFEIQEEIMKRLPAKSLIRFSLVSKQWKSLIHSSKFIADHCVQKHRLLVVSNYPEDKKTKFVSIADDDTFPQRKLDLTLPISSNIQVMQIESSHGLLCLLCRNLVVFWNPTIRKSVSIDVPDVLGLTGDTTYGFGVCPVTYDPKLVKMIFNRKLGGTYSVEVLTLSSGVWRSPRGNLPRKSIRVAHYQQVSIDGCIYLAAHEHIHLPNGSSKRSILILSFAMTSEEFTEIRHPNPLAPKDHSRFWISKLRESLVVIEFNPTNQVYGVWMMTKHGDPKSFTKIYNMNLADASLGYIYAFTTSGAALVKINNRADTLFVYEPNSKQISFGISHTYYVNCYTETLLSLDH